MRFFSKCCLTFVWGLFQQQGMGRYDGLLHKGVNSITALWNTVICIWKTTVLNGRFPFSIDVPKVLLWYMWIFIQCMETSKFGCYETLIITSRGKFYNCPLKYCDLYLKNPCVKWLVSLLHRCPQSIIVIHVCMGMGRFGFVVTLINTWKGKF